ncbi:MAG: PAS domain S-box protein, partial [bacterium]
GEGNLEPGETSAASDLLIGQSEVSPDQENLLFQRISFLQTLLDTIPLPVYFKDDRLRFLGCNRAYEELTGYSEEDILFKTPVEVFSKKYAEKEESKDKKLLTHPGQQVYQDQIENRWIGKKEVEIHRATFNVESGQPGGIIGVIMDITDRKRARRRLEKLNSCFLSFDADAGANIHRLLALAVDLLDGEEALYFSRSVEAKAETRLISTYQKDKNKLLSCPVLSGVLNQCLQKPEVKVRFHPGDEFEHCNEPAADFCADVNSCLTYPLKGNKKEGVLCIVYSNNYEIDSEKKRILELITAAISVEEKRASAEKELAERKKLLSGLEKSERKFRQMAENVRGVFWLFAEDFDHLEYVNSRVVELFRITPPELYETPWLFLNHLVEEDRIKIKKAMKKVSEGEIVEISGRTKDEFGGRWLQFNFSPITNLKGEIIWLAGFVNDVTEQKKIRQELEEAHRKLKEKTAMMIQNEKMTALGELTASVAHELNQPLNVINIIAQSLQRELDKDSLSMEDLQDDLKDVVGQVSKMAEIIDHMRIFSRRSEGDVKREVKLNELLEGVFKFVGQQLRNHEIQLIKDYAEDMSSLRGDPIRLEQVFMNLITNARNSLDEIDREEKIIEVRTYELKAEESPLKKRSAVVEVKDNGPGIPEKVREKIFEPFFTTREPGKGTGLGLSVSNEVVEEHNGLMELESQPGRETVFKVILPVENSHQNTE